MGNRKQPTRYLVARHARWLQRVRERSDGDVLQPGQQKLRSFLVPGLQGGFYTVDVKQDIEALPREKSQPEKTTLASQQKFRVNSPQFALPEGEIQSVYPPQGHEATVDVLPHVVFNTPSFPWEWNASKDESQEDYRQNRNRVPWLAVLVFTQDELQRSELELGEIFSGIEPEQKRKPGSTLAFNLPLSDIAKLEGGTISPIPTSSPGDPSTDVVLLDVELFRGLFTKYDEKGAPVQYEHPAGTARPYILHHRLLAHVRHINTKGMAVAALDADEDNQHTLGVIVSHRTGPFSVTVPTTCFVHLVSLNGVDEMSPWPPAGETKWVAMSSLHSWTYTCLPPDTITTREQFVALGESCALLKPSLQDKDFEAMPGDDRVKQRIKSRLGDGYSLTKYRTGTGEPTACFMRGPFTPGASGPCDSLPRWNMMSNYGTDLQILDKQLGIMDISLSAAWQLGRMLAIADQAFVASLGRVRKAIYDKGMYYKQLHDLQPQGFKSNIGLLAELPIIIEELERLPYSSALSLTDPQAQRRRWCRSPRAHIGLSYSAYHATYESREVLRQCFERAALEVASALDIKDPTQPCAIPYNEHNTPFNADWAIVLKWIVDRLYLSSIPAYYLITDSSHMPVEGIRFFKVDQQWMHALLDGALSLANHIDRTDDHVRDAILAAIKRYRDTPIAELDNSLPPFPEYGCYVRSPLVVKFPDLRVEAKTSSRAENLVLLRHEVVNTDTMLCLFSEVPSSSSFIELRFTQPPHQQAFCAGIKLSQRDLDMQYKKAYTQPPDATDDPAEPVGPRKWTRDETGGSKTYRWTSKQDGKQTRCLLMDQFAADYLEEVRKYPQRFKDDTSTSALMASQLGLPCWRLTIRVDPQSSHFDACVTSLNDIYGDWRTSPLDDHDAASSQSALGSIVPQLLSTRPDFTYTIWSTTTQSKARNNNIPACEVAQDLIFGIVLDPATAWGFELRELQILIPLGKRKGTLTDSYSGDYAEMLSNMRFNAIIGRSEDQGNTYLSVRLLPRSQSRYVPVKSCQELSFRLNGVQVLRFPTRNEVQLVVKESYVGEGVWKPVQGHPKVWLVPDDNCN
ncbi:hypothetical protein BDW62DRAFT_196836 [Aspergillus aurantiobrunneus]